VGRVARLPTVPRGVRVAQALLELERPLRRQLKRRLGPIGTDTVLALTGAAVQGLSQGPGLPAVDALYRLELLAEALSRRAVWERREGQLCCAPDALPREAPVRPPRPRPRPQGPIELWAERLGPGALGAAGLLLALTRHPGRAADMLLVAVPKAARRGREGFATTVGRELARRGVVPLNAAAWRRLDRISAIVLDSPLLCTSRPQVLAAEPAPGVDAAAIWQAASHALHGLSMQDLGGEGPWPGADLGLERDPDVNSEAEEPGAVRLRLRQGRRLLGAVTVGGELAPLAEAVLDAARSVGGRVLLTRHAGVAELLPRADEVLDTDRSLADHVLRLQADGHGVLVVSETADQALAVADVGVAVLSGDVCLCWSADLLCGPGLEDLWRILQAVAAARPVSERAVKLAQAGSTLGALLALVDSRRQGRSNAMAPVYGAALVALVQGSFTGMRVTRRPRPPPVTHVPWHALDPLDVLARLDEARGTQAQPTGGWPVPVTRVRATAARVARMPLVAGVARPVGAAVRLGAAVREELRDPLTPVLAVGAAASAVVGSSVDALLVAAVMSGNALVSGVQRVRAERALRRLFLEQEVPARRLRRHSGDGAAAEAVAGLGSVPLETVPASALSPGDVIALRASDVVPADARLLTTVGLEVDESTLTGESLPVDKDVQATPGAPLAERGCMVFDGTTVLAGTAYAVVVATGEATEAGRAARIAGRAAPRAGVQARLAELTRIALPATDLGGVAVTGLALLRKLPLRQAVAAGVSVAVAAVPEGLPLVSTVAQAAAARRLSRRGVLVRSARTLEALGRVDVVCFDKTGTLTEGRLAVTRLACVDTDLEMGHPRARRLLITAAQASPPVGVKEARTVPHATDRAILEAVMRPAFRRAADGDRDAWRLQVELPFQASRGYAASLGSVHGRPRLAVKGAPEVVLPLCRRVGTGSGTEPLTADRRRAAQRTVQRLAGDGLRVLAVAERRGRLPANSQAVEELVTGLTLLGFVGVADTPRPDAAEGVRRIAADGVRTVMITGDHPTTAAAIARAVDIPADGVVTGAELDRLTESERVRRVAAATVFARVSPEQKLRIVQALQADGHVVAMTGDGTNDAAAIRLADVGIGVAATGSSSARTAADLVLASADVRRIHDALLEGRGLWHRVRDAVAILVGGNAGEVAFMVLGTALTGRAPINVRQLLLVNMFTDMFPALAVAVAPSQNETAAASGPTSGALGAPLARAVAVRGGATTLGALLAWTIGRFTGRGRRASSMGLAALVGTQLGQTLLTGWRSPLVVATVVASAAALVALIEIPVVSQFFGGTPIGPLAWAIVVASAATGTLAAALLPKLVG
jgi:cation-transporting ATPase I